jgi:peptidoglycan/LPS O-acetylase OafA/YrhL
MWVLFFHIPTSFAGAPHIGRSVFEYGYAAVDLFFILSGFILVTAHPTLTVTTSRDFFWKRIFRIYPLHITIMLALAAGLILSSFVHLNVNGDGHYDWGGFPLSVLLLKPYFPFIPGEWNSATWSIGIELACYFTLPAVLPLARRLNQTTLWVIIAFLSVTMTAWLAALGTDVPHEGLGALLRGYFGFYIGCCLGVAMPQLPGSATRCANIVGLVAVVGIGLACALDAPAAIPLFSAMLIAALSLNSGTLAACISISPLVWLGQVSFSVYLIHLPMFTISNKLIPIDRFPFPPLVVSTVRDIVVTVGVLILSGFTYRFIETPGRRLPQKWGLLTPRPVPVSARISIARNISTGARERP